MHYYHRNAKPQQYQRSLAPDRPLNRHLEIPTKTSRTNPTHHPTTQKIREVLLERRMRTSFPKPQNHPHIPTYPPQAGYPLTIPPLHHHNRSHCKRCSGPRNHWRPTSRILR